MSVFPIVRRGACAAVLVFGAWRSAAGQAMLSPERARASKTMLAAERALFVNKDPTAARAEFMAALQQDSTFAAPRFNLGVLAEAEEQWSDAAKWFAEYLRHDSTSASASKARGELTVSRRRAAESQSPDVKRESDYDRHIELARRLLAAAMFDDARAEAARAHALKATGWEAYALASAAIAPSGRSAQALALLDSAIALAPPDAVPPLRASKDALLRIQRAKSEVRVRP